MSGEKSGKDMLLKVRTDKTIAITGDYFTLAGHGFVENDLIKFDQTQGTLGTTAFYFVNKGTWAALDGTTFAISPLPSGTLTQPDITDATVPIGWWSTVGGLRSSSFSFSAEDIDISNHGSNQYKELKEGAGMRSVSMSGSGVYTNAANYRACETACFGNSLVSLAFLDVDAGRIYSASFKINSIEASGEYDGEASFSISANSSGSVSIAQLGT